MTIFTLIILSFLFLFLPRASSHNFLLRLSICSIRVSSAHLSDPGREAVRGRLAVVYVEHDDGDEHTQPDEQHGEEQILPEQRHGQGGGGHDLGDEEEEHGLREEDADAEGHLLARVGRQVEDKHGEVLEADAGYDEVDGVEERAAPQGDVEVDIWREEGQGRVYRDLVRIESEKRIARGMK